MMLMKIYQINLKNMIYLVYHSKLLLVQNLQEDLFEFKEIDKDSKMLNLKNY